nr:MAG: capsid protein [Canine astrovirus]
MANKPAPVTSNNFRRRRKQKNNNNQQQQRRRRRRFNPRRNTSKRRTRAVARSEVKREVHRLGLTGPKVAVSQTVTATLGTIGANSSDRVELEMASMLNPALVKETNGSNAFGPIQALAAQFGLWRCVQAHIRFTPLVGSSAVSGTAVRASLNLTSTPGSTSWSGLGARVHRDVNVGQTGIFKLARKQLAGPRESWWLTNTNDDKTQSLGPTIEIHSLGQTVSTYQNTPYAGSLFLVELRATWEFANYLTQPSLATLSKQEAPASSVVIDASQAGEPITMTVTDTNTAQSLASLSPMPYSTMARATGTSVSSTIFQVVDASVSTASSLLPPPFGWLLAGGWWFVKRVINPTTRATTVQFQIYASAEDAAADRPCIATGTSIQQPLSGMVQFNQINAPNTGTSTSVVTVERVGPSPAIPAGEPFGLLTSSLHPVLSLASNPEQVNGWVANLNSSSYGLWIKDSQGTYCGFVNQAWWYATSIFTTNGFDSVASGVTATDAFTLVLRTNQPDQVLTAQLLGYNRVSSPNTQMALFMLWAFPSQVSTTVTNSLSYTQVAPTPRGGQSGFSSGTTSLGTGTNLSVSIETNSQYVLTVCIGNASASRYTNEGQTIIFPDVSTVNDYSTSICGIGPLGFGAPGSTGMPMTCPNAGIWTTTTRGADTRTVTFFEEEPDGEFAGSDWDSDCESMDVDDSDLDPESWEVDDIPVHATRADLPPWLVQFWDKQFLADQPDGSAPAMRGCDEVDWAFRLTLDVAHSRHMNFSHPYDDSKSDARASVQSALAAHCDPDTAARRAMEACPHPFFDWATDRYQYNQAERRLSKWESKKEAAAAALLWFSRRGHAE